MENSKIEIGKTYTLRNGLKTSEIKLSNNNTAYIFQAEVKEKRHKDKSVFTWKANGRYLTNDLPHKHDIIL
jgi:hypothetical protein